MNTPAQVTEAHRTLVRSISWAGITSEFLEKKAQLIADSEARAAKTAIAEWERQIIQLEGLVAGANAERDRLRAEVRRLTASSAIDRDMHRSAVERAERAEAELAKERARHQSVVEILRRIKTNVRTGWLPESIEASIDAALNGGAK